MSSIDKLKEYYLNIPEVKRLKELEHYIDHKEKIKKAFDELKDIQKKLVSSKEFHQPKQYQMYLSLYNTKKEELLDMPFVEEYLELVEIVGNMLKELSSSIEYSLAQKIRGC